MSVEERAAPEAEPPRAAAGRQTVSVIQRAADEIGLELYRDAPVPGRRRVEDWAKLIGMARKLEGEEQRYEHLRREKMDALIEKNSQANARNDRLAGEVIDLKQQVLDLSKEVAEFRLKERMREIHLAAKDAHFLLTGEPGDGAETSPTAPDRQGKKR